METKLMNKELKFDWSIDAFFSSAVQTSIGSVTGEISVTCALIVDIIQYVRWYCEDQWCIIVLIYRRVGNISRSLV